MPTVVPALGRATGSGGKPKRTRGTSKNLGGKQVEHKSKIVSSGPGRGDRKLTSEMNIYLLKQGRKERVSN